jgi:hypothetical protein
MRQCCGTMAVTFYCVSGTDFGKVLVPATNPEPDFVQNFAFLMIRAALFRNVPRNFYIILDFFTFVFHFMLDPDPNPDLELESCGSCGSRSTTPFHITALHLS